MFTKTKLEKAQGIAGKAIGLFTSTIGELQRSNDLLFDVLDHSELQIAHHTSQVADARATIKANKDVMIKLNEFCP